MGNHDFDLTNTGTGTLTIVGRTFSSRLMLGTGKYRSPDVMAACHRQSGAEIITAAVRRLTVGEEGQESILDHLSVIRRQDHGQ